MKQQDLDAVARQRVAESRQMIEETLRCLDSGTPLEAEGEVDRRPKAALRGRLQMNLKSADGRETTQGARNNFLPVSFLANGADVSRSVARVVVPDTNQMGTGFLCAPGILLTNFHVLQSPEAARSARVEFDFVSDDTVAPTTFRLDPDACFIFDLVEARDYVLVGVGPRQSGPLELDYFGWCPLSPARDKHALGEFANIIQHPDGRDKQVVLQDNLIAARGDFVLHYLADTEGGSSGSPVFNNFWQVIALHHWGEALHPITGSPELSPHKVNEGIRISQIVSHIEDQRDFLAEPVKSRIDHMLQLGRTVAPKETNRMPGAASQPLANSSVSPQGRAPHPDATVGQTVTWEIPLRVSVEIPGFSPIAAPYMQPSQQMSTQTSQDATLAEASLPREGDGYKADFLDNHVIKLPELLASRQDEITSLKEPHKYPSAKLGELQFRHFSVVMNEARKMCFFGACNVDGETLFGIGSSSRKVRQYSDIDVNDFASSAEAAHSWLPDWRIDSSAQTVESWYTRKNKLVPRAETDDTDKFIEIADFDRGHIVRRTEPIWGPEQAGKEANRQTYNHVNACPQQPRFNQDKRRHASDIQRGEETRSWYGLEVAVLRATTDENKKMSVFTGPIFEVDDPIYGPGKPGGGNRQVPLTYWKVAVWEGDEGKLKSLAMKASQFFALSKSAAELAGGAEALDTAEELVLLRDFLTTIKDIETRTGIRFDPKVKRADVLKDADATTLSELTMDDFGDLFP